LGDYEQNRDVVPAVI